MLITILLLLVAIFLFARNLLPPDLVALLTAISLGLCGILTPHEVFSGFSHPAVITIISICILAEALEKVGITERLGAVVSKVGGKSEPRVIASVMIGSGVLSLFMNNIAAAALILPVAVSASRRNNISVAKLGMPLAIGTLLGGMATLFTTMNIVVSALLREHGYRGFGVFEFAPIGLPLLAVGTVYMLLWGRKYLPHQTELEEIRTTQEDEIDLIGLYGLGSTFTALRVESNSSLAGRSLGETELWNRSNVRIIAIEHNLVIIHPPVPTVLLRAGDIITLQGANEEIENLHAKLGMTKLPGKEWHEKDLETREIAVTEVALSPRSALIGKTLKEIKFREKYDMTVLAIWRGHDQMKYGFQEVPLEFGDALLLQGSRKSIRFLKDDRDLIYLGDEDDGQIKTTPNGKRVLFIMLIVLIWASFDSQKASEIMLCGALLIVLTKVLDMEEFYRSIEWKTVFLVAGMLPMGIAVTKTGFGALVGTSVISLIGSYGPVALLASFFGVTVLLTQFITGAAAVTIMAPIAIGAAEALHANPRTFGMAVALASSVAFLTPLSHPVNMLVMGPCGYTFNDFRNVGWPLTLIICGSIITILAFFYPLVP